MQKDRVLAFRRTRDGVLGCLPDRVDDFREGIAQALAYAKATGCGKLHVLAEFDQFEHLIGHVQIADWPGRGAPGTGNGDWQALWDRLKRSHYSDFIGCEYLA